MALSSGDARAPADRWLLVDGSSLIFRAFYAVPQTVRAPDGHPVNGIRGSLDALARYISTQRPRRVAMAADTDWRPAWRVQLIPEYKLHRVPEPIPPALIPQMAVIENILSAVGVDFVGVPEYEAEDVIAGWTSRIDGAIDIASGDRDLFALVEDPRIRILYPEKGKTVIVDEAEVTRRYGIPGRTYADFAVLRGDPSDGLPGLKGVGAVAAAGMIRRYGGVEGLLREGTLMDRDRDYVERAWRVVRPRRDLAVELPAGRRDAYPVDDERLRRLAATHSCESPVERLLDALRGMIAGAP